MRALILVLSLALCVASNAATTNQIVHNGITWQFSASVTNGYYVNGDPWVIGPVGVTNILPRTGATNAGSWFRGYNGSMTNPPAGNYIANTNGFDTFLMGTSYALDTNKYSASKNVAVGVGYSTPLTLAGPVSLVSAWSKPYDGTDLSVRPSQYVFAVLTVVTSEPATDAFRPQPYGGSKVQTNRYGNIDWSKLLTLTVVSNTPSLSSAQANLSGFIPEFWVGGSIDQYIRTPTNAPVNYPGSGAEAVGDALGLVNLNYTQAQKSNLVVWLVQYGIDIYGAALDGAIWRDLGGLSIGRKSPLLFAGSLLNDSSMIARANGSNYFIFQEDRQTWYIEANDTSSSWSYWTNGTSNLRASNTVGRIIYYQEWTGSTVSNGILDRLRTPFIPADIGVAEWADQHTHFPFYDGRNLDAPYRDICTRALDRNILVMRLMGLEDEWNWPPAFDYVDRMWGIRLTNGLPGTDFAGGTLNWFPAFAQSLFANYWTDSGDGGYTPTIVTNNANSARVAGFRNLGMSVLPIPSVNTTADLWQTFEFTDPTVANLTANDNTSTGTWLTNDNTVLISTSTTGERALLGTVNGSADTGHTRGLAKSHTANDTANVQFDLSGSAVATISAGVWFKFVGPTPNVNKTIFDFSNSGGEIIEVAMEGTTKMVGFSGGGNNGVALVSGNFYWITAKVTQNATSYVRVYDTAGALVGTEVSATAGNQTIRYISLGDTLNETADNSILTYWDDFVLDWTDATYPLGL